MNKPSCSYRALALRSIFDDAILPYKDAFEQCEVMCSDWDWVTCDFFPVSTKNCESYNLYMLQTFITSRDENGNPKYYNRESCE